MKSSSHVRKLPYLCVPTLGFEKAEVRVATLSLRLVKGTTVYTGKIAGQLTVVKPSNVDITEKRVF